MRRLWRYFKDARLDKELIRRQAETIIVQKETIERLFGANRSMEVRINELTELAKNSGDEIIWYEDQIIWFEDRIRIADDALRSLNVAYETDSTFMRSSLFSVLGVGIFFNLWLNDRRRHYGDRYASTYPSGDFSVRIPSPRSGDGEEQKDDSGLGHQQGPPQH